MSLFRDFEYFKEEIELAFAQNSCVEIELYSIIASIIRESQNTCSLSVRDVSNRRKTNVSERYCSDAGFPDFVVLAREKDIDAPQYGCIEAKMPTIPLNKNDKQLKAHIQKFGKVIYTNGIRWMFFEASNEKVIFDISLGKIQEEEIVWNSPQCWNNLLEAIDNIKWY